MRRFLASAIIAVGLCAAGMTMAANDPPALADFSVNKSPDPPNLKIIGEFLNNLRDDMRDPDSFKVEKLYASFVDTYDRYTICVQYRSKNGFGGYERGFKIRIHRVSPVETSAPEPNEFDPNALQKLIIPDLAKSPEEEQRARQKQLLDDVDKLLNGSINEPTNPQVKSKPEIGRDIIFDSDNIKVWSLSCTFDVDQIDPHLIGF